MKISKMLAKDYRDALNRSVATADFAEIGDDTLYTVVESVTPYDGRNSIEIDAAVEMLREFVDSSIRSF